MEENTKKILLLSAATVAMAFFCYYAFVVSPDGGNEGYINLSRLDSTPSRQSVYAEKHKRERQMAYDRRVSSLEDFLGEEIEKEPFTSDSTTVDLTTLPDTPDIAPAPHTSVEPVIPSHDKAALEAPASPKPRRVGFASGTQRLEAGAQAGEGRSHVNVLAVVHEDQQLHSGSVLKLRTLEPFSVGSLLVPVNTFLLGEARLSADRLFIDVSSVSVGGRHAEVALEAFDLQGHRGLIIAGGVGKAVRGEALEHTVEQIENNVSIPLLRDLPFTSAKRTLRTSEIPIMSGYKLYLRTP